MKEFEKYLKENTLVIGKNIRKTERTPFDFKFEEEKEIKGGMHAYVTRVKVDGKWWAIKEGRTDLYFPIATNINIPLNRSFWGRLLRPLGFDIMLGTDRIAKEMREYFLIAKYFGYYEGRYKVFADNYYIRRQQREIRKKFGEKNAEFEEFLNRIIGKNKDKQELVRKAFRKQRVVKYNYLVDEYLLFSRPKKAKIDYTFYIVQEWFEGHDLSQLILEDLSSKVLARLIVFVLLAIYMFEQEQKLIDVRGSAVSNINWFMTTENVVVNEESEDVKFIDTRWLWDLMGNFVEKGVFSADMLLHSMVQALEEYLVRFGKLTND